MHPLSLQVALHPPLNLYTLNPEIFAVITNLPLPVAVKLLPSPFIIASPERKLAYFSSE